MLRLRYFFLLLAALVLGGCGGAKPRVSVAPKPLPEWFTHPPASDETTLYAAAEGTDRPSALNNALNRLAANLGVVIASQYASDITEIRHNGRSDTSATVKNSVQAEVKKIRITDYRIVRERQQGFRRYLVLIAADRKTIFNGIRNELDQKVGHYHQEEKALHGHNPLQQLLFYKKAAETSEAIDNTLLVLQTLDPAFDPAPYRSTLDRWKTGALDLQKRIRFSLHAKTPLAKRLAPVLREGLTSEHLLLGDKKGPGHFTVIIDTDTETAKSLGFFLARTSVSLKTVDDKGRTVAERKLDLIGQSSQSQGIARQNVAVKLKKILHKEGIFRLLGLVRASAIPHPRASTP